MTEVVIVDAIRTPLGKRNGWLREQHPVKLGARVIRALVDRSDLDKSTVDHVIFGCVSQVAEQTFNVARNVVLDAELPIEVPATAVDFQCGSSQQARTSGRGYGQVGAGGNRHRRRRRKHDPRADGFQSGRWRWLAIH